MSGLLLLLLLLLLGIGPRHVLSFDVSVIWGLPPPLLLGVYSVRYSEDSVVQCEVQ